MSEEPRRLVGPDQDHWPQEGDVPGYCIEDLNGIDAVLMSIISDLDKVDIDLLPFDPFGRWAYAETNTASRSVDAIVRAKWYLDYALSEGKNANNKGREYADIVIQELNSREAAEERQEREFEERTTATIAEIDKLGEFILQQQADDPQARKESEERTRAFKQIVVNSHQTFLALKRIGFDLDRTWLSMNAMNFEAMHRHERRRSRRRLFHAGQLLSYAILVVVIGVFVGDGLNGTKFSSLWAALVVAIVLWVIDRWLISPRLERWNRAQELRELKADVTTRAGSLRDIRLLQSSIDIRADYVGVPRVKLLSSNLMRLPVADPPSTPAAN